MIKIGILGVGGTVSIADLHVEAIKSNPNFVITKVYNRTYEKATHFIEKHHLDALNCDALDMFFDDIDAVIITTSNKTHKTFMYEAAKHHVHMLVEKPLSGSCEDSSALYENLKDYPKVIMIGYLNRYASVIQKTKDIIDHHFTKIYTIQGSFGGKRLADPNIPFEWRMDVNQSKHGASIDFGSHLLDLITYITKGSFKLDQKVISMGIQQRKHDNDMKKVENDDAASLILHHEDTLVSLLVSRVGLGDIKLEISGDGGLIDVSYSHPKTLRYHKKMIDRGYTKEHVVEIYDETQLDLMKKQLDQFYQAISNGNKDYPDLSSGKEIDCLIDA